jgi:hypothetical protein
MKPANTPGEHNWRVVVPGPKHHAAEDSAWYFETQQDAETQADLVSWADPRVEAYVLGIGWVPASKVGK